jgi:hypothetical protein
MLSKPLKKQPHYAAGGDRPGVFMNGLNIAVSSNGLLIASGARCDGIRLCA